MKKQRVNWILYSILGFVSILIIAHSLKYTESTAWFTIVSGIGCGAFASVLIAFLIEVSNVTQVNRKNRAIFESYFSKLYFTFANLLFSLVIACDKEKRNDIDELFWFDWLERVIKEQIETPKLSAKEFLVEKLQDAEKELEKVEESKLLLLGQGLMDEAEFLALTNIKVDISVVRSELNSSSTNWRIIKATIPEVRQHIEESNVLKKFNKVSYKEDILKLLCVRCNFSLGGKHVKDR